MNDMQQVLSKAKKAYDGRKYRVSLIVLMYTRRDRLNGYHP